MAGSPNEDSEGSRITYVKGDLFACPKTDSLAHCISEDCRMGAGIAVLFKKKFGGVQELLNQRINSAFKILCLPVLYLLFKEEFRNLFPTDPPHHFLPEIRVRTNHRASETIAQIAVWAYRKRNLEKWLF
ncbi:ADP-ribose glycohydrolase OARD1 isoform X2 [Ailuropoda melanoleuca]|uniref:ADP-ribose glycohydrolase OARD1 isoform X2 n=1 Tax=Ailuropoda melanoleuca TaxID=9646 RepID=UPI0014943127|nr:ADP-ribose glycohydrolase OARD1 isoform X2 [Ailuropoda melanoleuca]